MGKEVLKPTLCIVIHGVELDSLPESYANDFMDDLRDEVPEKDRSRVFFAPYNWSTFTNSRQKEAFERMEKDHGYPKLRLLKHTVGSDIMWYAATKKSAGDDVYSLIHSNLDRLIDDMVMIHGGKDFNLVLIGHSWGTQIALDHCFESKHVVDAIVTMGSPIGAVSGRFPDWGHLPPGLRYWLNIANNKDFICSFFKNHPSKEIAEFVDEVVISSWNPLNLLPIRAHGSYWKNKKAIAEIAKLILSV